MSEAPERIWANENDVKVIADGEWWHGDTDAGEMAEGVTPYVRADIHTALQQRVEELEAALRDVTTRFQVTHCHAAARAALTPPE